MWVVKDESGNYFRSFTVGVLGEVYWEWTATQRRGWHFMTPGEARAWARDSGGGRIVKLVRRTTSASTAKGEP